MRKGGGHQAESKVAQGEGWRVPTVKGLKDWIVAPLHRVSVEEELRGGVPEDLIGRELKEDLCIRRYELFSRRP